MDLRIPVSDLFGDESTSNDPPEATLVRRAKSFCGFLGNVDTTTTIRPRDPFELVETGSDGLRPERMFEELEDELLDKTQEDFLCVSLSGQYNRG